MEVDYLSGCFYLHFISRDQSQISHTVGRDAGVMLEASMSPTLMVIIRFTLTKEYLVGPFVFQSFQRKSSFSYRKRVRTYVPESDSGVNLPGPLERAATLEGSKVHT